MTDVSNPPQEELDRQKLGERLREARKYVGLKQEDVAAFLKIPRTALGDIESGQRRVEAIELTRLAKLYKQPVAYFTGEEAVGSELSPSIAMLARKAAGLSDRDRDELTRFVEYLQTRSQSGQD
jgi:transcriptional regulator with XRE-family HTH domain